jgi:hypothetical protein
MPNHELPTITFEPFPHGRPPEYKKPHLVDIMLASLPPQVFPPPPAPALPSTEAKPAKPPRPRVPVEPPFKDALIEEIDRLGEPVKITQFATAFARNTNPGKSWKEFEQRKISLLRQVEQLIRDKILERIARRFVTTPRKIHPDKLHYFK